MGLVHHPVCYTFYRTAQVTIARHWFFFWGGRGVVLVFLSVHLCASLGLLRRLVAAEPRRAQIVHLRVVSAPEVSRRPSIREPSA